MIDPIRDAIESLKEARAVAYKAYSSGCREAEAEEEEDPRTLDFSNRLDKQIEDLEALIQEFQFLETPAVKYVARTVIPPVGDRYEEFPSLDLPNWQQQEVVERIEYSHSDPCWYLEIRRWPDGQTRKLLRPYKLNWSLLTQRRKSQTTERWRYTGVLL